jgi:hypothetical protein
MKNYYLSETKTQSSTCGKFHFLQRKKDSDLHESVNLYPKDEKITLVTAAYGFLPSNELFSSKITHQNATIFDMTSKVEAAVNAARSARMAISTEQVIVQSTRLNYDHG